MGIWTAPAEQTIALNNNLIFTTSDNCGCAVTHRTGSGLFTLHGGKKYKLSFGANVASGTADTEVDLAVAVNGEEIPATRMASTPSAADSYNNVSRSVCINVPCGCCYNVSIKNVGTTAIDVRDAYMCITKED